MSALPQWLTARFGRTHRRADDLRAVIVTLTLDASSIAEAMRSAAGSARAMRAELATLERRLDHHRALRQAGLEARTYVTGAMDPTYADEAARDAEVRRLAQTKTPGVHAPSVAASFLRGWVEHHEVVPA